MKTTPCQRHSNADLWFTEMPQGTVTISSVAEAAEKVKEALHLCETRCHMREQCLAEGMKPENLSYGIWGGKMSGERLIEKGYQLRDFVRDSAEWRAIVFTIRMTPWVRW